MPDTAVPNVRSRRAAIVVLDGVGAGEAPDAVEYGDLGSDTLANTARAVGGFDLPTLESLGLGRLGALEGVNPSAPVAGAWGQRAAQPRPVPLAFSRI